MHSVLILICILIPVKVCFGNLSDVDGNPQCGHPGLPLGSELVSGASLTSEAGLWSQGERVSYACAPGWLDLSPGAGVRVSTRECRGAGQWSALSLHCEENLAIHQPTLQSGTFVGNYSHLAVDGDASTCSLTPASPDQRWWQVQVRPSLVSRVLVLARAPASVASLSVFVIELLPGTKAEYKRCERVEARREEYTEYECHGVRGEFVYIRDDRMVETEHLGLCEVVVTPTPEPHSCGVPEGPVRGSVVISENRSTARFKCREGFTLVGDREWQCQQGRWGQGVLPTCVEMNCSVPVSPLNGRVQVSANKKSFRFGSSVIVVCHQGFLLSGNNTRQCVEGGQWTGAPPSCEPIICPDPAAIVNGLVELVNGSTRWKAVASYQCLPGFYNYGFENTSQVRAVCQITGAWSGVSMTCMADPAYSGDGDIPWREKKEVNTSTVITISILSVIIFLIIVAIILTVLVKRSRTSLDNERKISTSSTDQLLYNQINVADDKTSENDRHVIYDKWNISPEKNYSLLQKFPANDAVNNLESDNIYSTLKKPSISSREANDYDSQDCIDYDDEDAVYATVNFNRNSVNSVICDQRMNDGDQNHNQKIITVSNDVHDLYAKIDVNKKKNRK